MFHNEDIGVERVEAVFDDFLAQITDLLYGTIPEITRSEEIVIIVYMEFDRREFDDFDTASQKKLWDTGSRNHEKIYVWSMLSQACNDGQSPEGGH